MSESFRERGFVADDLREIIRQRGLDREAVFRETRAHQVDRFLHRRAEIERAEVELRRVREVIDLGNDPIEPLDFLDDDFVEIAAEIRVVETLGKELRKGLDRDQRVAHFVRHARGEIGPEGGPIRQLLFLPERFLRREIRDDRDCA